jgi:hypothetical protein
LPRPPPALIRLVVAHAQLPLEQAYCLFRFFEAAPRLAGLLREIWYLDLVALLDTGDIRAHSPKLVTQGRKCGLGLPVQSLDGVRLLVECCECASPIPGDERQQQGQETTRNSKQRVVS